MSCWNVYYSDLGFEGTYKSASTLGLEGSGGQMCLVRDLCSICAELWTPGVAHRNKIIYLIFVPMLQIATIFAIQELNYSYLYASILRYPPVIRSIDAYMYPLSFIHSLLFIILYASSQSLMWSDAL